MKRVKLFTVLSSFLLAGFHSFSADIYLSPAGNDGDSGASGFPVKTLTKAISLVTNDGDIIHVDGLIDVTEDAAVTAPDGVTIASLAPNFTIDGGDKSTSSLSGKDRATTRILNVAATYTGTLTVRNLTFINGGTTLPNNLMGSAVNITSAKVDFENCDFKNCTAGSITNGGTVAISGTAGTASTVNFLNCLFDNNLTFKGGGFWANLYATVIVDGCIFQNLDITSSATTTYGGAIQALGNITIKNSSFVDCKARNGGAVQTGNVATAVYKIQNCTFDRCNAVNGGVIHAQAGDSVIFSDVTVRNSQSTGHGAGIYIDNISNFKMSNSTIQDCSTTGTSHGGAIYLMYCKNFMLSNSIIKRCKASGYAGAIYAVGSTSQTNNSNIDIRSCLFMNDSTGNQGGAVCINATNTVTHGINLSLVNSTFTNNYSPGNGGAIAIYNVSTGKANTFTIINSTVAGNSSNGGNAGFGGGIRMYNATQGDIKKYFYNNVIEGNVANGGTVGSDLVITGSPVEYDGTNEPAADLFVSNNYIDKVVSWVPSTSAATNTFNYNVSTNNVLATPYVDNVASFGAIPLISSTAYVYGKSQYLADLGINTDQFGNVRPFTSGKCAVGAYEYLKSSTVTDVLKANENIRIYQLSGKDLNIVFPSETTGWIEVVNAKGTIVKKQIFTNQYSCEVSGLLSGFYIVKVSTDKRVFIRKIIIR